MITISLIIVAGIVLVLGQLGIIENPLIVFVVAAIIIAAFAFILRNKLNCPFAKKCPFTLCPLNKKK